MFKTKYITQKCKILYLILFIVITSCSVNDKQAFNILDEAKKFLSNISKETDTVIQTKDNAQNIEQLQTKKRTDQQSNFKSTENREDIKNSNTIQKLDKKKPEKKPSEKVEVAQSKLILKKEKARTFNEKKYTNPNKIKEQITKSHQKIGVLLPLSGDNKDIGNLILNALELALFQIENEKIELVIKDTMADPSKTRDAINELMQENIKIFIGPLYSTSLASIEQNTLVRDLKIFALTNNTNLAKENVWIFGVDPQQQIKAMLEFLMKNENKKIGFLLPDNSYGYLLYNAAQQVLKQNNMSPTRVEFFNNNIKSQEEAAKKISTGFNKYENYIKELQENFVTEESKPSLLNNIIEKPLDSIFIGASGQTLTILASQLQYNSVNPKIVTFTGTSSWEDASILQEPALKGGLFSSTTDIYYNDISEIYELAYGSKMPKVAMIAYDILSLMSATFNEYGDIDPRYILNETGFLGLRGLFRLKSNGSVERTFQIKKITKSKFIVHQEALENFN
ncbi:MAG: penicillin-binding protein activator [Pseudomonadota bacterium]|nr:penicillin-binding protein activator [Pseudomonadota bacterium]